MPWNRQKLWRELDRKRLPEGVRVAARERPQIAADNVIALLRSDDATARQIANAVVLATDLLTLAAVSLDQTELFKLTRGNLAHPDPYVRVSAGRCCFFQMIHGLTRPSLQLPVATVRSALSDLREFCPELSSHLHFVEELIQKKEAGEAQQHGCNPPSALVIH